MKRHAHLVMTAGLPIRPRHLKATPPRQTRATRVESPAPKPAAAKTGPITFSPAFSGHVFQRLQMPIRGRFPRLAMSCVSPAHVVAACRLHALSHMHLPRLVLKEDGTVS